MDLLSSSSGAPVAISVSEFVAGAKRRIERDGEAAWVTGEVVDFARAASGHWYFALRDSEARVDCVMLARQNRLAEGTPQDGDLVAVFGSPALYAPRARFQIAARFLRFDGAGRLHRLFLERKRLWRERGWFGNARSLPVWPGGIGVVCSVAGAALHDVLRTLAGRWPLARVVVYPAPAQGEGAAARIAAAVTAAGARGECDVALVCRGGGSAEDLQAYNEEAVVRAIYACGVPVVSGIGHETDETLADYAADLRCATPTAAAAAVCPCADEVRGVLGAGVGRMTRVLQATVDAGGQRVDWAARLLGAPARVVAHKGEGLRRLEAGLRAAALTGVSARRQRLAAAAGGVSARGLRARVVLAEGMAGERRRRLGLAAAGGVRAAAAGVERRAAVLEALSPEKLLARGYSIVTDEGGRTVRCVGEARGADGLRVRFSDGVVGVRVV